MVTAVLVAAVASACTTATTDGSGAATTATPSTPAVTTAGTADTTVVADGDVLPGLPATLRLPPTATDPVPLVVLVPGGGWTSADPTGLVPLAETLATAGIASATTTYRTATDGALFPTPVQDVACAIAWAAAQVRERGLDPAPVVVLGHSAGGHLAALVTLAPQRFRSECPYPPVDPDALVGLAGVYDVTALPEPARALFGSDPDEETDTWEAGNPMTYAARRPGVPVLLAHGSADTLVPRALTTTFDTALRAGGHPTRVVVVEGADHDTVYLPDRVAAPLLEWIGEL